MSEGGGGRPPLPRGTTASVWPVEKLSDAARAARGALSAAVYPPQATSSWAGRDIEWAAPSHFVCLADATGTFLCHVGSLVREGSVDDRPVRMGGIGGVMTHPDHRRRGLAAWAIDHALAHQQAQGAAFSLLVCKPELIPLYMKLGWALFDGEVWVRQKGEACRFTFNKAMLYPLDDAVPTRGKLDLCGAPW